MALYKQLKDKLNSFEMNNPKQDKIMNEHERNKGVGIYLGK